MTFAPMIASSELWNCWYHVWAVSEPLFLKEMLSRQEHVRQLRSFRFSDTRTIRDELLLIPSGDRKGSSGVITAFSVECPFDEG
jgi:hypothetical protein